MSTESLGPIIQTATVAIFPYDLSSVLIVHNKAINLALPPGGKREKYDREIEDTCNREVWEEVGFAPFPGTGIFLDSDGVPTGEQPVISTHDYKLLGKLAKDHLFAFRLHEYSPLGETQVPGSVWATYEQYSSDNITIDGKSVAFLLGSTRDTILRLMQKPK